jgi:hypothetical protein
MEKKNKSAFFLSPVNVDEQFGSRRDAFRPMDPDHPPPRSGLHRDEDGHSHGRYTERLNR